MKSLWISLLSVLIFSSCSQPVKESNNVFPSGGEWMDLSYSFSSNTPYWPTAEGFRLDTAFFGTTPGGYFYSSFNYQASEHGGTHLDAPFHFAKQGWSTDAIPLSNLIGEAVLVDISQKAEADPDYAIQVSDIEDWEKKNGKIPENAILIFRTGFGKYYPDPVKYLGTSEKGPNAVAKLHFPGIGEALAEWLVANRKVKAVGIDTPSIDRGQSGDFKAHQILYAQNICGFENLASLDRLPAKHFLVIALPMKIEGGSGGPLRIVAWLPGSAEN